MVAGFLSTSKKSARDTNFPPRVTGSDEYCSTEKSRRQGPRKKCDVHPRSHRHTLHCLAPHNRQPLRASRSDPSLSWPRAHCPQHALITSDLSRRVSSHCWSSRESWVGGVCRTCVLLPTIAARSRLGFARPASPSVLPAAWTLSLYRTRLFSHALHHVVLRCHDDCVEDGSAQ